MDCLEDAKRDSGDERGPDSRERGHPGGSFQGAPGGIAVETPRVAEGKISGFNGDDPDPIGSVAGAA